MKLLRLYPRAWRERYEAEMIETLEEHGGGFRTNVNLLRGALDAHLHRSIYTTSASGRSATMHTLCLALIPSCFVVVQFLLNLDLHASSDLENSIGTIAIVAAAIVATGVGYVAHDSRASLIAGAVNGAAAFAFAWLVGFGLLLVNEAGLVHWAYALQGGTLTSASTGPGVLQELVGPEYLGSFAVGALGAAFAGGLLGAVGGALSRLIRWGERVRV